MSAALMMGHNRPDEKSPLRARLEEQHAALLADIAALAERANAAPATVESDDVLGVVSDLAKSATAVAKRAETARTSEKEPYLAAGREIDGFFKALAERLERIGAAMKTRATEYLRRKEAEERRRREEEARKAREEAEARMREAAEAEAARRPIDADTALDRAAIAATTAQEAIRAAEAPAADLARTRSASGASMATLRTTWDFEIDDLGAIDLEAIRPYLARADIEKAIRAYVAKGNRRLRGARIFERSVASIR